MTWGKLKRMFTSLTNGEKKAIAVTVKNFHKPLSDWSTDDLEWGLIGCAHDMDNALDMIIGAEDEEDASKAGQEFMDVVQTHDAYLEELKRRG